MVQRPTVLMSSVLLLCLSASAALALAPCDATVVDIAELLSPREEAAIADAARKLELLGATVYVRTSTGNEVARYDSLRDASDAVCDWETNRMVYWVTIDENNVGMFPGPLWKGEVTDGEVEHVIDEAMIPALQNGSVATAFLRAIEATPRFMESPPVAAEVPLAPKPAVPVVVTNAPEANEWSLAMALAWIFGCLVVIAGAVAYSLYSGEQLRKHTLAKKQQAAVLLGNQCKAILAGFNATDERVKTTLREAAQVLHPAKVTSFTTRLSAILADADVANQVFNGHHNPETADEALGWYESLLDSLTASKQELDAVVGQFEALEADVAGALAEALSAPVEVVQFTAELAAYESRLAAIEKAEFTVTSYRASLKELASAVAEIEALVAQRRFAEARERMNTVRKDSLEVVETVEALPRLRQKLTAKHQELSSIYTRMPKELAQAAEAFATLEATCAEACYASIEGNGTEAEVALDTVDDLLNEAGKQLSAEAFAEAEALLTTTAATLQQVDTLIDAIMAKVEQVAEARTAVKVELAEALRSIEVAEEYLVRHDAPTSDSYHGALKEARAICTHVAVELKKKRPDYLDAFKRVAKADDLADVVLKDAHTEKERAERERQRADVLLESSLQDLTEVRQYVEVHKRDMSIHTNEALRRFDPRNMRPATNLDTAGKLAYARNLAEGVAAVFVLAKQDFATAEAERAREREAARLTTEALRDRHRDVVRRPEAVNRSVSLPSPVPRVQTPEPARSAPRTVVSPDRSWGTRPTPSTSGGVEKSWRAAAVSAPSGGTAKPVSFLSPGRGGKSGGLSKKW